MRLTKQFGLSFLAVLAMLMSVELCAAQGRSPQLAELRRELALNYLEPQPHMALAKYYWERNDRLQAFYLLEYARRARFQEPVFNQAFVSTFGAPSDDSPAGEAAFNQAVALQSAGKLQQAEALFVKAAELAPRSAHIQTWVGRFFFKVKQDNARALPYYLNAYFLDPHAYESEFVESRIARINAAAAAARLRQLTQGGAQLVKALEDSNPTVVLMALEQLTARWQPLYLKSVLNLLGHDDEAVRWQATEALMKNADRSFDQTLRALLRDDDLRKRGLAAYLVASLWKEGSFDTLRAMLREEAELLRFDALSALVMSGGSEGLQLVIAHRQRETHPVLKQLIDSSMSRP